MYRKKINDADPIYGIEDMTPAQWQGSIIASRQRALIDVRTLECFKPYQGGCVDFIE
jgi:hypothetical protein